MKIAIGILIGVAVSFVAGTTWLRWYFKDVFR